MWNQACAAAMAPPNLNTGRPEKVFELPPLRRKKPIIPETPVVAVDTAVRLEAEVIRAPKQHSPPVARGCRHGRCCVRPAAHSPRPCLLPYRCFLLPLRPTSTFTMRTSPARWTSTRWCSRCRPVRGKKANTRELICCPARQPAAASFQTQAYRYTRPLHHH